ncbi:YtxH domain-containing protein [Streptomyces pactum]|uniref:YtxH domain-containing protein n=1 Tax=Streptomyces pactum TaxID=68249 RepID=A0ABS0NHN2_9ACTN|nr:YtxH domain-containing protein [Streptomyces pactum]MBH5334690.1 YtxH domain-containing protein [Streptomyces pactum]
MRYRLTFMTGVAVGYVLGARAGRERYEQLCKKFQRFTENPAVRNTAEAAALGGRKAATKAFGKVEERLPDSVSDRVHSMRGQRGGTDDGWGTSNT